MELIILLVVINEIKRISIKDDISWVKTTDAKNIRPLLGSRPFNRIFGIWPIAEY